MVPVDRSSVVPLPVSGDRPLKRVVSMTGAYGLRNYTVKDLRDLKGVRQLVETNPDLPEEAAAAEEAGIDTMKLRFDPKAPQSTLERRRAALHTFMTYALSLTAYASKTEALRAAFDAMEGDADSIMCQWSLEFIEAVASAGIPVQSHVGLVPRKSTWTGGLRAVGKTVEEALQIHRDIKDLENAGAWGVECEVIPAPIMRELSKRTTLVTSSIGSGSGGDIQFLFAQDLLGDGKPPFPRHAKQYCDLYAMRREMQKTRVAAFKEFISEVRSGAFPGAEHTVDVSQDVVNGFLKVVDK
ncbi:MAG: 3-methyl-2-oxobutanoate hydroxymethyltransferase [Candidatus Tectomicrobia bacterium]|nr:3-methyl-2-oxobutanoate hydroxymethyltransferase [Candidatus Tectomicrobia bacterium]